MNSSNKVDLLDEIAILGKPGGSQLQISFTGPFEGKRVRWQAILFTPTAWASHFGEAQPPHNIILIGDGEQEIPIHLCLKVKAIDHPTIRKAVMMVRQYKRLKRGRHEYG